MNGLMQRAVMGAQAQGEVDALAFELARNKVGMDLPIDELLVSLNVSEERFLQLAATEVFQKTVRAYVKELTENGMSFKLRAAIIAEDGLRELDRIIHDPGEAGTTRLKALEKAVDWGQLAPKESSAMPIGSAPTIVFNFPPGVAPPATVEIVQQPEALPST